MSIHVIQIVEELSGLIANDIKDISEGNVTSSNILKVSKIVDTFLYRKFGDEDLIVANNNERKIKHLSVFFNKILKLTDEVLNIVNNNLQDDEQKNDLLKKMIKIISSEQDIDLKDFKIDESDKNELKFNFMLQQFLNKILQFCFEKYNKQIDGIIPVEIAVPSKIFDSYKKNKDKEKLVKSIRRLAIKEIKNSNHFDNFSGTDEEKKEQTEKMIEFMVIKIVGEIIEAVEKGEK
jgi:hypothetical protein